MSESKKSLCDTCLYAYNCVYSDKGISGANHSICNVYVPVEELITDYCPDCGADMQKGE